MRFPIINIFVGLAVPAITGAIMAAHAETIGLHGRWRDASPASRPADQALAERIDFVSCGAQICGIAVAPDDSCGAVIMRLTPEIVRPPNPDERYKGEMRWREKTLDVYGQMTGEGFRFNALNPGLMPLSRRSLPTYVGFFRREGDPKCATPIS